MMGEKLTVGAIGVGAVGSILAACLAKAGAHVVAADLPHRIAQLKKNGLQVQWDKERLEYTVDVAKTIRSIAEKRPDCIFVATKAVALRKIMPDVAEAAGEDCLVISVHNGINTEDEVARYVAPRNVARMVVNYAGNIDDKGLVRVGWFNPPNFFGLLEDHEEPRLTRLIEMLNSVGLTSEFVDPVTIKMRAFLKTILNSALMPLCAVMNLTMKQAMEGAATRPLVEDLLREGLSVAGRLGYDYGEGIFEKCMGYLDKGGDHYPSMCGDLQHRVPTEIDFINGKILELGQRFDDLDLGVNRVMISMLMTEEVKVGVRKPNEFPDYLVGS
ncbi:MAG: ketopantoate reductase family protein [Candidatus Latescibacterota bacterium]|nr:MAG: ketopantoate reductase family protein [Candidatus Latescibacterota bacterium]